jgi:hypothetical protein
MSISSSKYSDKPSTKSPSHLSATTDILKVTEIAASKNSSICSGNVVAVRNNVSGDIDEAPEYFTVNSKVNEDVVKAASTRKRKAMTSNFASNAVEPKRNSSRKKAVGEATQNTST